MRDDPFLTEDAAAAFKHFLPRIAIIPIERIQVCRVEPTRVLATVERSVDSITPHLTRIKEELPKVSIKDLLELPALTLGLVFAAGRPCALASSKEIDGRLVIRDRFWTALFEGYITLRKVGIYLFGEDGVDARIPSLERRRARGSMAPGSTRAPASSGGPTSTPDPISTQA